MNIESLISIVEPPAHPVDQGSVEMWNKCEEQLGLTLPSDYRDLIQSYGTGRWMDFLWVLSPFTGLTYLNLFDQASRQLDAERAIRNKWPQDVPFALYPEAEGLLPWAITDNGDRVYWQTRGQPENWPTIVCESRGPQFDRHSYSCTEFLFRWITGELNVSVFPNDLEYGRGDCFTSWNM